MNPFARLYITASSYHFQDYCLICSFFSSFTFSSSIFLSFFSATFPFLIFIFCPYRERESFAHALFSRRNKWGTVASSVPPARDLLSQPEQAPSQKVEEKGKQLTALEGMKDSEISFVLVGKR